MYSPDVVSLKQFYATAVGDLTAQLVWKRLQQKWPMAKGETVLGLGYAIPFLQNHQEEGQIIVGGMPQSTGALYWPSGQPNRVAMLDEGALPFADDTFNRVLLVHELEYCNDLHEVLNEIWRVLVPGGRLLALVPNRLSIWSRAPRSPFGYGRPFTVQQMRTLLDETNFTYLRCDSALYAPPFQARWFRRIVPHIEETSRFLFPLIGGVLLVEAEKQIYASVKESSRVRDAVRAIRSAPAPAFTSHRTRLSDEPYQ